MSNIVFIGAPAHGHVNPTLPVVQELVERGERVVYYDAEEFQARIEATGATFCAYPQSAIGLAEISAALQDGNLAGVTVLILRATETLLPDLLERVPGDQPDLIIFDSIALWGRMAATLLNVRAAASITHFILELRAMKLSVRGFSRLLRMALPKVPAILASRRRLTRRFGSEAFPSGGPLFPVRGGLNIVYTARELQPPSSLIDASFRFVGPSIRPRRDTQDFPFHALGNGTAVYISLGTVHHARGEFYRTCFEAFANYPARFVLSTGTGVDRATLDAAPANFIVAPSVPQLDVLQRVDAFITHGGMNSVHEALYYGVPMLVLPHQFEQLLNARVVESQGAGVLMDHVVFGRELRADELRRGLDRVLTTAKCRDGAARVRDLLRATKGYLQAADEIQAYLAGGVPKHP